MSILVNATSNFHENQLLNWLLRQGAAPGADFNNYPYLSLYTSDPTDDNTVALANEVSGNGYTRMLTSGFDLNQSTGIGTLRSETNFPTATPAGWGTITDVGLCTSLTTGSLIFHARVNPNEGVYVSAGDTFSVLSGPNGTAVGLCGTQQVPIEGWSALYMYQIMYNLLNNTNYTSNGLNVYAKLFTTMPGYNSVGGIEVPTIKYGVATNYVAPQIAGTSKWTNPTSGSTSNTTVIDFFSLNSTSDFLGANTDIGYVEGMCFYYISGTFNQLAFLCPFDTPILIKKYDNLRFPIGKLKIGLE